MKELTNPELLQEKGLQLQENEDGTATLIPYEKPLENGGKWLPEYGENYHTIYFDTSTGLLKKGRWLFDKSALYRDRLKCGLVFPEESIVDSILETVNDSITFLKENYWEDYKEEEGNGNE